MGCEVVTEGMEHSPAMADILSSRGKIAFVLVTFDAGVDEIVVLIASTGRAGLIMVHGQLTACIDLRDPTVATLRLVALPYLRVLGMGHSSLLLDAEKLTGLGAQGGFQDSNFSIEAGSLCLPLALFRFACRDGGPQLLQRCDVRCEVFLLVEFA
jgi:hypothetical protein